MTLLNVGPEQAKAMLGQSWSDSSGFSDARIISDSVQITFPIPEGAIGATVYRSATVWRYPWWAPDWLRARLPYALHNRIPSRMEQEFCEIGKVKRG